jgi:hypothetical protein
MLQQLTEDKDSTGTSLFLHVSMDSFQDLAAFENVTEFTLVIYRGPFTACCPKIPTA